MKLDEVKLDIMKNQFSFDWTPSMIRVKELRNKEVTMIAICIIRKY